MRHKLKGNRLSRNTGHRLSMLKNLSKDLILYESVETTLARAKELKRYAEKIITRAKEDTVHNRRQIISKLGQSDAYKKLFDDVGVRYKNREGGYTRIIRVPSSSTKSKFKSFYRKGDGAELARVELVKEPIATDQESNSETVEQTTNTKTNGNGK